MFKKTTTNTTIEVLEKCVPTIFINTNALTKMWIYTEECLKEIGWLGMAIKDDKKNIIYIEDTILFKQEVHSTTTELTPEGLAEFGEKLLKQKDGMEMWNKIKVWGHSHVNMSTSPSGQDNSQMETFAESGHDWFARIITNKSGDMRVDLYLYDLGIIYNNIPWFKHASEEEIKVEDQINALLEKLEKFQEKRINKFQKEIQEEIKAKVKEKKYTQIPHTPYKKTWDNYHTPTYLKKKTNISHILIKNIEDVYKHFDQGELLELGECQDFNELRALISAYSGVYYNNQELRLIWTAAKELVEAIYFNS